MNADLLNLTETYINKAFQEHNAPLLQKEAIFLLNSYVLNMSEYFSDVIDFVKPVNVRLKTEPDFIFTDSYISSLKKILSYSEQIMRHGISLLEAKLAFDSWFYEVTEQGALVVCYNESQLMNVSEAAKYLDVTRPTMYKYIERGLETVGEKHNQRIPLFMLEAWKDPATVFRMQWNVQLKRAREGTIEEQLSRVVRKIEEFEKEYAKPFYILFGHLSDHEIDGLAEAVNIFDWKELEGKKQKLLGRLRK